MGQPTPLSSGALLEGKLAKERHHEEPSVPPCEFGEWCDLTCTQALEDSIRESGSGDVGDDQGWFGPRSRASARGLGSLRRGIRCSVIGMCSGVRNLVGGRRSWVWVRGVQARDFLQDVAGDYDQRSVTFCSECSASFARTRKCGDLAHPGFSLLGSGP